MVEVTPLRAGVNGQPPTQDARIDNHEKIGGVTNVHTADLRNDGSRNVSS